MLPYVLYINGSGALRLKQEEGETERKSCRPGSCASHPAGLLAPMHLYRGDQ